MNIITISREFGSGGRELGKRLADILDYTYYDREIETELAKRTHMDADYIAQTLEDRPKFNIPLHFGRTLASPYAAKQQVSILLEKQKLLKELAASSNCVIVGRAADVILSEYNPLKIFVFADMEHKIKRCQNYAEIDEKLSPRELKKAIRKIDARRSQYNSLFPNMDWRDKKRYHYHMFINTTTLSSQERRSEDIKFTLLHCSHSMRTRCISFIALYDASFMPSDPKPSNWENYSFSRQPKKVYRRHTNGGLRRK